MSRELDAAIAEALGHRYPYKKNIIDGSVNVFSLTGEPHYSTDGNAMLELDKEMRREGYEICSMECIVLPFVNRNKWKVAYRKPDHLDYDVFESEANTEPLARALAAYKALTGKDWEEG